jgi:hypothetical protein
MPDAAMTLQDSMLKEPRFYVLAAAPKETDRIAAMAW